MYWIIEKGHYIDSLESLFATTVLNEQPGIRRALVGMATGPAKLILQDVGLVNEELLAWRAKAMEYERRIAAFARTVDRIDIAAYAGRGHVLPTGASGEQGKDQQAGRMPSHAPTIATVF